MTAFDFSEAVIAVVSDLSRELPVEVRYGRLLEQFLEIFPCHAVALLKLEGEALRPLAVHGLNPDTLGRRFVVDEHPRLASILHSREAVRFSADCDLPDPYDGLVEGVNGHLPVHDCMGASLYLDERPWGVLTMDAMEMGTFDRMDPMALRMFVALTEASVKAEARLLKLKEKVQHGIDVTMALIEESHGDEMIGNSKVMRELKQEVATVAGSDLSVLVLGETGVGKELVARQIHDLSARAEAPLVYVNCAALPESIAESELFGHVKGAFSGAVKDRAGKFEVADGGTLFLDEVGELDLSVQAKLLRALQTGEVQRVGSDQHIEVNVRIVAATNRDLQREVAEGRFRADLYHRLSVYPIQVPPLRERAKDVVLIAGYLLEKNRSRLGVKSLRLTPGARHLLSGYHWPGHVRELEHLLSRAALKAAVEQGRSCRVVSVEDYHLDLAVDLAREMDQKVAAARPAALPDGNTLTLKAATDAFQRQLINEMITQTDGNQAAAAALLGVDKSNFYRLVKRLGMNK